MKTIDEMRARYAEQMKQGQAEMEAHADQLAARWIFALEEAIEEAAKVETPCPGVRIYANQFTAVSVEATLAAADKVSKHFSALGFNASPVNNGRVEYTGVRVTWAPHED